MIAPSYIAGIVTVLIGLQSLLGLDFAPEQWEATIVVLTGIVVAARQLLTGRSNLLGGRPQ